MTLKPLPLAALILAASAHAAELGEATVRSYIGQQLIADVELTDLTPQDLADLQVRLASRNVFLGANVTPSPALAGLNVAVVKRDGRRMLHLTTSAPIPSELLHLYFELWSGGRQSVRGVTLWLTPAPPAPLAPPAPVPQPTRVVTAPAEALAPPAAAVPEAKRPAPRAGGVSIQLAAAGVPGKQATRADAELLGAVERAFAARGKPAALAQVTAVEKPAPAAKPAVKAIKPVEVAEKKADKPVGKPADKHIDKAAEKPAAKPVEHVVDKAGQDKAAVAKPEPAKTEPAKAIQAQDQAMLKKLAELEAKLKMLQKMVGTSGASASAPAAVAPTAHAVPGKTDEHARPAKPAEHKEHKEHKEQAEPAEPVKADAHAQPAEPAPAAEPPGRTATGRITDARGSAPAAQADKQAVPQAKSAAPMPAPPAEEPAQEKKMSRPKVLTMIAGASVALLAVLAAVVHFVRRRNAKNTKAQIKVWQSWRKKAIAEAAEGEAEGGAEGAADAVEQAEAA